VRNVDGSFAISRGGGCGAMWWARSRLFTLAHYAAGFAVRADTWVPALAVAASVVLLLAAIFSVFQHIGAALVGH
jgi:hypothetical protein